MDYNEMQRQLARQDSWHAAIARGDTVHAHALVQERDRITAAYHAANAPPNFAPSGGGGAAPPYFPSAPPPPPPKPIVWLTQETYQPKPGIKQADPDTVLFNDDAISPEFLVELGYEDISGMELINISRSDIIDGQNVIYSPVKQLTSLRERYNPNNIISLPELSSSFFSRFQIDLLLRGISKPYFDGDGNLVIEIDTIFENEIVDIEIDTSGTINIIEFLNEEDVVS